MAPCWRSAAAAPATPTGCSACRRPVRRCGWWQPTPWVCPRCKSRLPPLPGWHARRCAAHRATCLACPVQPARACWARCTRAERVRRWRSLEYLRLQLRYEHLRAAVRRLMEYLRLRLRYERLRAAVRRSCRKARTAAAGGGRVRVLDDELRALQVFLVVDLGADQVLVAHRIDQQRDTVLGHRSVVFVGDLIEGETVLKARAAAALHEHAQLELRVALLGNQLRHLGRCAVGEQDGCGHSGLDVFGNGAHGVLRVQGMAGNTTANCSGIALTGGLTPVPVGAFARPAPMSGTTARQSCRPGASPTPCNARRPRSAPWVAVPATRPHARCRSPGH